ncbi:MAG: acyl carrier protein [Frankiaceae bacterium]|nr:acyl carrier protein [Frankiaceae bacterium]
MSEAVDGDVEGRIREVMAGVFELSPAEIGPQTSKDTVERWDSLQQLTLVISLEEEFGIQLSDEETASLLNYPLIVAVISDRIGTGVQ